MSAATRPGRRERLAASLPVPSSMVVAGIMSGTSADGLDVALCRIAPGSTAADPPRIRVLAHYAQSYTAEVRAAILAAMNADAISVAQLARLSWRLGALYADAVEGAVRASRLRPALVAMHGQTLYHQAEAAPFLGAPVRCTWQTGEPAVLAERLGLPVISDLRPADVAAGGQGAPLVPMLDLCAFGHAKRNRILLNLGGIANLTALPAACSAQQVLAFDIGPANMILDACMERLYRKPFDEDGATAARGKVLPEVLRELLADPFLAAPPPRSCGREQYGFNFADRLISRCTAAGARKPDILATATAFTAEAILDAYRRFVLPHLEQGAPRARATELFVSGGGARNLHLLHQLRERLEPLQISVKTVEQAGSQAMPSEAKEAAAFALLGWLSWHGLPGNLPAATGARNPIILGRITHV